MLKLPELIKDDASSMVRRSVANNLNDLGRVHPDLLVRTAAAWLLNGSAERRRLVEHARSAGKRGDAHALRLLGYGTAPSVAVERVRFTPRRVSIGRRVVMTFTLRSPGRQPQDLLVDVAVHFVKARGRVAAKVFKLTRLTLAPGVETILRTSFSLAVHTARACPDRARTRSTSS